ncbi:MAG TPA: anti-sigma factor domain-containing protein [Bacillota bacterium]|nr:anti-sigma factor domain-containing protein [Bacillota bacterium]
MKGIVIDVMDKDAVILSDDGLFKKIKNKDYEIGQTLQLTENMESASNRPALGGWKAGSRLVNAAASIAAVMVMGTIGAFAYYTPTDYVSLDVNPSIEYSVNMFERILDAKAVNEDGQEILSDLNLKNKDINEALRETLDQLKSEGYLEPDKDSGVVIATSSNELIEAEKLAKELKRNVRTYLDTQEGVAAKVTARAVSPAKVKEAESLGVSAGKLYMVEKLQASTRGAIDRDEWLSMPVKDINKAIKENRERAENKPAHMPKENWKRDRDIIQSPISKPVLAIPGLTQNQEKKQSWNQYSSWPVKRPSEAGIVKNDAREWTQTQNQTWNRNQNKTWDRNKSPDQGQRQGPIEDQSWDQNQKPGKDQSWNWNQNKTPDQGQRQEPVENQSWDKNQRPGGDQNRDKNWNQTWNRDQNKTPDQDQRQKPAEDRSRDQNQKPDKDQSRNQGPGKDQNWNWNQNQQQNKSKDKDQTSNQAIWNGGWHSEWGDSDDDDRSKDRKQSGGRKNSRDR